MTDLPDALSTFRPVTPDTEDKVAGWLQWYRRPVRYFLSPSYLGAEPNVYSWGVVDECLCLLKRRQFMNNPVMHLVVPPIHWRGDVGAEQAVIRRWLDWGVGVKVSDVDVEEYGIEAPQWIPSQAEFLYLANDFNWPPGKAGRPVRRALLATERAGIEIEPIYDTDRTAAIDLTARWAKQTGRGRTSAKRLVARWFDGYKEGYVNRRGTAVRVNDQLVGFGLTEEVAPGRVVYVSEHHDYEDFPSGVAPGILIHAVTSHLWPGATLNTGGVGLGTPGLGAHKTALHPSQVLRIGVIPPTVPITLEAFRAAKPTQKEPQ